MPWSQPHSSPWGPWTQHVPQCQGSPQWQTVTAVAVILTVSLVSVLALFKTGMVTSLQKDMSARNEQVQQLQEEVNRLRIENREKESQLEALSSRVSLLRAQEGDLVM